jgi:type VI secretion system secreted protein Hcp
MAVDIFLKLGDLVGESIDSKHGGEIDVLGWSWGMNQSGTMHLGTGGGGGKVTVQNLAVTKYTDKATPAILCACATGSHYPTAVLTVRKAGGAIPLEFYTITMQKVLVTQYSTRGADEQDRFIELVALNFEQFHVQYQPQGPDGSKLGGVVECTWNIPANASS